jgi:hypothetical protein
MFNHPELRYLVSAESLTLFVTCFFWMRVWTLPTADRIRLAALSSATLVGLQAVILSLAIMVTTVR